MATTAKAKTADKATKEAPKAAEAGFDTAFNGYEEIATASQKNIEAVVESLTLSQKGLEAINTEALTYSKKAFEDGVAATKAAFGAKDVQELIELNTTYTQTAFDAYVNTATKLGEMFTSFAKDASAPLNARATATVEAAQANVTR